MENQTNSTGGSPKRGWIGSLIGLFLSYYADLISRPFGSGLVYFFAGLVPALAVGWLLFPLALYSGQPQPLRFSHAVHNNRDIGISGDTEGERCLYCHSFREDGTFAGTPKLETCMECHNDPGSPLGNDPEEKKFLTQYVEKNKEIPWLSYFRQPDNVYFSHIAHVKMGNLDCRTCHGDHGRSETTPVYQQNRLTGYSRNIWGMNIAGYKSNPWDRMKMDDCGDCHARRGHPKNNDCFVCHK
jgi:menaquinone reductase, multiheme cytochrome c subunit